MTREEVTSFRKGDPDYFETLVEGLSPRLLSVASGYADDADVAHDIVQETWVRAYERRAQFTGQGSLLGWLMAICRSLALGRLRSEAVRTRERVSVAAEFGDDGASPVELTERGSLSRAILDAIHALPDRQRETVALRLLEGKTTAETARIMECAEGTVKAALHAAINNLTPKLKEWAP